MGQGGGLKPIKSIKNTILGSEKGLLRDTQLYTNSKEAVNTFPHRDAVS